jgi:abhydrolase domain-containing protein 12
MPFPFLLIDNKVRNVHIETDDGVRVGAWHILPSHYYMGQRLRFRNKDMMQDAIYDLALGNPDYETVIYFHGNAGNRAAPWRVDLYKVTKPWLKYNILPYPIVTY